MATWVNYQFWSQAYQSAQIDGRLGKLLTSGTLPVSGTMSQAFPVPKPELVEQTMLIIQVYGADKVYAYSMKIGDPPPADTGTHAPNDTTPRLLFDQDDGACRVPVQPGGAVYFVQAAALT